MSLKKRFEKYVVFKIELIRKIYLDHFIITFLIVVYPFLFSVKCLPRMMPKNFFMRIGGAYIAHIRQYYQKGKISFEVPGKVSVSLSKLFCWVLVFWTGKNFDYFRYNLSANDAHAAVLGDMESTPLYWIQMMQLLSMSTSANIR